MNDPTIRRADDADTLTVDGAVTDPTAAPRTTGPVASAIDAAGPTPDADHGSVHSGDGLFTASIPLDVLREASIDDGGRLQIDDPPTRCWLVKDVRRIELTVGRQPDSLPDEERERT